MLESTCECRYLFDILFSFPLDVYSEMGFLDHIVVLFLIFWGNFILFSIVAALNGGDFKSMAESQSIVEIRVETSRPRKQSEKKTWSCVSQGRFILLLPPPPAKGHLVMFGDTFACPNHAWLLLAFSAWGQGCCSLPRDAQGSAHNKKVSGPKCQ